uniref:Uncharacterized protein n=1 Tax=Caenorhabditis japonica TaxID=281687 RepID=A0A8R1IJN4_CAEJA
MGLGMPMGMGMGMPMMPMSIPMQFVGNPFDNGMEIEYSPITQLVSSIAHLVEMHQRSKEREDNHHHPGLTQLGLPFSPGASFGSKLNVIPYAHEGPSSGGSMSSTSRLINSIPNEKIPDVMWRIGDLIGRQDKMRERENVYDTSKINGFPIIKTSENTDMTAWDKNEKPSSIQQSWTILEIARKILGVDEIPTAKEGNAIAQLVEEWKKEKRGS